MTLRGSHPFAPLSLQATLNTLLMVFILAFAYPAQANTTFTVSLDQNTKRLDLRAIAQVYSDDEQSQSPAQIYQQLLAGSFITPQSPSMQFGYGKQAVWLAVNIEQVSPHNLERILEVRYPPLDDIQVYAKYPNQKDLVLLGKMGDSLPYGQKPVDSRNYLLPILFKAHSETLLLIRVTSSSSISIPIYLSNLQGLYEAEHYSHVELGIFYGVALGLFFYNLFLLFSTRNPLYLYYIGYVFGSSLFMASIDGLLYQFWPNDPDWESRSIYFFTWIGFVFLAVFCRRLLRTEEESPNSERLLKFLFYYFLTGSSLILVVEDISLLGRVNSPSVLLCTLLLLGVMVVRYMQGSKEAAYTIFGMSCFFFGILAVAGGALNLHGYYEVAPLIMKMGSAIELVMFSIALAHKIKALEISNFMVKQEAMEYLKNYEDLYENSITGQFQLDDDLVIKKFNPAFQEIAGVCQNEPCSLSQLFTNSQDSKHFWESAMEKGSTEGFITQLTPANKDKPIIANLSIRKDVNKGEVTWIGSLQDITDLYEKEEALKQAQQDRTQSLKQLVMGFSHEMNTPLGNIKMSESFVSDSINNLNATQEEKEVLTSGLNIIEHNVGILRQLGDVMKQSIVSDITYNQKEIAPNAWFDEWQEVFEKDHPGIHITLEIDENMESWVTYPYALNQIIQQLLNNSSFHNQELHSNQELNVTIKLAQPNTHEVVLDYSDNGKGLDLDDKDKIFQPFYTTERQKATNKGLGLYLIYNLVTELFHGSFEWPEQSSGFAMRLRLPK